jgi:hypothetical protein
MSFSALVNLGVVGEDISGYTVSISGCTGNTCQSGCSSLTTGQSVNSFPKSIDNIPDGVNSLYINVDDGPCAGTNQCIDLTFIYILPTPTPTNTPTLTPTPTPTLTPTPTSPPIQLTINWELFENVGAGGDPNNFVDGNMKIFVNGAQVIEIYSEDVGNFTVNSGDLIMVEYFYYNASQGGGVSAGIINPKIELVIGGTLIASNVIDPNVSATYNHTFTATSNTSILVRSIGDVSAPTPTPTPTSTPVSTFYLSAGVLDSNGHCGTNYLTGTPVYVAGTIDNVSELLNKTLYSDPSLTNEFNGGALYYFVDKNSGASTTDLLTNLGQYPVISITSNGYVGTVETTDCSGDGGTPL